ncbi:ATP-binding protein [Actinoallomurus sp. NPDC050550]|uniref:ATP-binding protein n=1 Tax=Actinoallomurus sp. NPDC050550 TaxID=3154937 RepID=UPI00340AD652
MTPDPAAIAGRTESPIETRVRSATTRTYRPSWVALRARPEYAAKAREFAVASVFGLSFDAYEVGLVTSEIVTNAIVATAALGGWPDDAWPLRLEVAACDRWVRIAVTDPDHRPLPASNAGGQLIENGRGLSIVDQLVTVRWVTYAERAKTVHVVLAAPGVTLTTVELRELGAPT